MNPLLRVSAVAVAIAGIALPVAALAGSGPSNGGSGSQLPPGLSEYLGDLVCWPPEAPGTPPEGLPLCEEGQIPIQLPQDLLDRLVCWPADLPFDPPEGLPVCAQGQLPVELPPDLMDVLVCWPADLPFDPPEGLPVCAEGQLPIEIPPEVMDRLVCWPAEIPFNPPGGMPRCEEGQLPVEIPEDAELVCWPPGIPYDPPEGMPVCEDGQGPFPPSEGITCLPEGLPIDPPEGIPLCEPGELPESMSLMMLFPAFEDVAIYSGYYPAAQAMYYSGVMSGCSEDPRSLCPNEPFKREEMAVVIHRAFVGVDVVPATPPSSSFTDVANDRWSSRWVNALKAIQLTAGCNANGTEFCPDRAVTRGEMAVFALRVEHGQLYTPPEGPAVSPFADMSSQHWAYDWIVKAFREGLIAACGPSGTQANICVDSMVPRDEAAQILAKAMGIVVP